MSFDRKRLEASLVRVLDGTDGERVVGMGFKLLGDTLATACTCLPRSEGRILLPDPDAPTLPVRLRIRRRGTAETALAQVLGADPCSGLALLGAPSPDESGASLPERGLVPFAELVRALEAPPAALERAPEGPVHVCTHDGRWVEATAMGSALAVRTPADRIRGASTGAPVFDPAGRVVGLVANCDIRLPDATLCALALQLPGWALRRARKES